MSGKKYFLTIQRGTFSERQGNGPYETFNELTGRIVNISFKETGNNADLLRLHIVNENNFYLLSMFANSRSAFAFFMCVNNIDFFSNVVLKIRQSDGKDFLTIHQYNERLPWYFGFPGSPKLPGKIEERLPFLKNLIQTEVVPALQKIQNPYPHHLIYKPAYSGLQGGYFDAFETKARVPGPVSETERTFYERGY